MNNKCEQTSRGVGMIEHAPETLSSDSLNLLRKHLCVPCHLEPINIRPSASVKAMKEVVVIGEELMTATFGTVVTRS